MNIQTTAHENIIYLKLNEIKKIVSAMLLFLYDLS